MQKPDIERRAEELHKGCRMPMEQAREIAASEASPDWYARGQDWGLADALTNCHGGDWVLDDIARAFAAGASAAERAGPGSYTHPRAHETVLELVCRLLLEKNNHLNNHIRKTTINKQKQ